MRWGAARQSQKCVWLWLWLWLCWCVCIQSPHPIDRIHPFISSVHAGHACLGWWGWHRTARHWCYLNFLYLALYDFTLSLSQIRLFDCQSSI